MPAWGAEECRCVVSASVGDRGSIESPVDVVDRSVAVAAETSSPDDVFASEKKSRLASRLEKSKLAPRLFRAVWFEARVPTPIALRGAARSRAQTRRTSGGVQNHLQHRARTESGADDVGDSLGFGEGRHGRSATVVASGRCQAIFERRRRRFDRQICAWPAVAFAPCRREKRTFAAAMLLSCAVRPVSRFVLVSARVRERRAGQRRVETVLLDAEEYKRGSLLRGGKQPERDLCPGGAKAARTHDHDGGLHALHGGEDLSRYATTLLLQDLRDAARVSVAVFGVALKGKAIGDGRESVESTALPRKRESFGREGRNARLGSLAGAVCPQAGR